MAYLCPAIPYASDEAIKAVLGGIKSYGKKEIGRYSSQAIRKGFTLQQECEDMLLQDDIEDEKKEVFEKFSEAFESKYHGQIVERALWTFENIKVIPDGSSG
tara:strand:+ start:1821 stop:2126 length:306 start_codon:yes stop_codon:yes gene_type:complete